MKKIIMILGLALTLLALAACQPAAQPIRGGQPLAAPRVLAVESFLADIAQNVAGDRLRVETLMPLGLDPHAFDPTPQDVVKIAESQVLIVNGAGFETWLQETLQNAGGQRQVIEAAAGLTSRTAREGEQAVMTPAEKVSALCTDLADKTAGEAIVAGSEAAFAADLLQNVKGEHVDGVDLFSLKLGKQSLGFGGFVRFDVPEGGDYVIAAAGGSIQVWAEDGRPMEVKEMLSLDCAGLSQGLVLQLEAGKYIVALSGLGGENTPFVAGAAIGYHYHEGDPHFWLDPISVITYVENIRDGLSAADPQGKDIYAKNADAYIAELIALDEYIRQQVSAVPEARRQIVTNHESFGYFADRYGFKIIGAIMPSVSTGASPSAQQLARLVDHIKETQAIAIFLETGANPQLAEQISQETGIRVVTDLYTHSITGPDGKAPTYIAMMKYNAQAIVAALK